MFLTKKCIFVVFAEKYVFPGLAENTLLRFWREKCVFGVLEENVFLTKKCVLWV